MRSENVKIVWGI